jgi:hypothetical protein
MDFEKKKRDGGAPFAILPNTELKTLKPKRIFV